MITLRQLSYLVALDRHRNFTRAAASVFVSQSALSQQIKELEDALGAPLLSRSGKSFTFTKLGQDIVNRAEMIADQIKDIELLARQSQDTPKDITIGIIPTVAPYILPYALRAMRVSLPDCH